MLRLARLTAIAWLMLFSPVAHADPKVGQPAPALMGKMLNGAAI